MFIKIWKKARQLCKEEAQMHRTIKRLQKASLDYDALQEMVNKVAYAPAGVEIHIITNEGMDVTIRQSKHQEVPYESFYDKYTKQHNS